VWMSQDMAGASTYAALAQPFSALSPLEWDDLSSNRHPALHYRWSMILSENRCPLFGIML
jgi:hypothetical protein